MGTTVKSSVHIKSAGGDPKKLSANLAHDGDRALFSTTLGQATGSGKGREDINNPGTYGRSLLGYFECTNNETGDTVSSKIGYFPDTIQEQVLAALDGGARVVSFAFESYVIKGGTAGFTWAHEIHTDASEVDPLAAVRALLGKSNPQKALSAPDASTRSAGGGKARKEAA